MFEKILGDFEYTREARREAEEYLLKMVKKMSPVLDTQVIFAFNPKDKYHEHAKNLLTKIKSRKIKNAIITDVNIWEFAALLFEKFG